ncbi:tetratricopeptide repeat protein [Chamaesiphon minutus]|uniref:Tfp pilus assembly protein PilF n=1 Tax=Chamaesiphon minutus (strain ATCC 27169 / PCC 6605) TaxID=1173020 RepID=K9ULH7_CHAP6|nr:tetratricopeptide repeat protein [Chamaesiphon minutus]AFY95675.1 Tfp pilus assembly protein PilF [Chamaesiphon minutus PCC 6605]
MNDLSNLFTLLDRARLLLFQMYRYQEAEILLQQCLSIDPNHAPTHALLAINYANMKQGELAIASAKKAIELAPDDSYNHYSLACAYRYHGLITRSERAITVAIGMNTEIPEYFGLQAENYIIQSQYTKAFDALRIGLRLDPRNIYCLQLKLKAFMKLRLYVDAELVTDLLLPLCPNNAHVYRLVGDLYQLQNKNKQSIAAYQESLRLNPVQTDLQALVQVYIYR